MVKLPEHLNVPRHYPFPDHFDKLYQSHHTHLKLMGMQPKTIEAYGRGMRRIGEYFAYEVEALAQDQLTDCFDELLVTHSWSGVKLDLYGFKFFTVHVLRKPWVMPNFIRPPKITRLPDILTVAQMQTIVGATKMLSYPVPELDDWLRRRVRMCYWKQWRWPRTKIRHLLALGVSLKTAIQHGVSSKSYWHMARTPAVQQALSNAWLKAQGLVSVKDLWCKAQGYKT